MYVGLRCARCALGPCQQTFARLTYAADVGASFDEENERYCRGGYTPDVPVISPRSPIYIPDISFLMCCFGRVVVRLGPFLCLAWALFMPPTCYNISAHLLQHRRPPAITCAPTSDNMSAFLPKHLHSATAIETEETCNAPPKVRQEPLQQGGTQRCIRPQVSVPPQLVDCEVHVSLGCRI